MNNATDLEVVNGPQRVPFVDACKLLGIRPNNSRQRMVEQGYLRRVDANVGNRCYYLPTAKAKGLFTYTETGFQRSKNKTYFGTRIFVTPKGRQLLNDLCGDLPTKARKKTQQTKEA